MTPRVRRRLLWLVLVVAVLAGAYCLLGVTMTSSFAAAAPERAAGHQLAARIYLGVAAFSAVIALTAAVGLWRGSRSRPAI